LKRESIQDWRAVNKIPELTKISPVQSPTELGHRVTWICCCTTIILKSEIIDKDNFSFFTYVIPHTYTEEH